MTRARIAIAHFADGASAEPVRAALLAGGSDPAGIAFDPDPPRPGAQCHLEVALTAPLERALLDILLASDAIRVDVHDVRLQGPPPAP